MGTRRFGIDDCGVCPLCLWFDIAWPRNHKEENLLKYIYTERVHCRKRCRPCLTRSYGHYKRNGWHVEETVILKHPPVKRGTFEFGIGVTFRSNTEEKAVWVLHDGNNRPLAVGPRGDIVEVTDSEMSAWSACSPCSRWMSRIPEPQPPKLIRIMCAGCIHASRSPHLIQAWRRREGPQHFLATITS